MILPPLVFPGFFFDPDQTEKIFATEQKDNPSIPTAPRHFIENRLADRQVADKMKRYLFYQLSASQMLRWPNIVLTKCLLANVCRSNES